MHPLRQAIVPPGSVEIKCALVGPVAHDGEAVEQRHIPLLGNGTHLVHVRADSDHGLSARAVLHVHQYGVASSAVQRVDAGFEGSPEIIELDPANGVDGTSLPYYQVWLLVD